MKASFVGREMFKKQSKRFLTMALCAGMALSNLGGVTVFAAGDSNDGSQTTGVTAKTINVGANAMTISEDGWSKSDGQYLYYGTYEGTPVKYRVLDRHTGEARSKFSDGTSTMTISGGGTGDYLLIHSDDILFTSAFDNNSSSIYSNSLIQSYLKNGTDTDGVSLFNDKETVAIAKTNLAASPRGYTAGSYPFNDSGAEGNISFLLSSKETDQLYSSERSRLLSGNWWLRSNVREIYPGLIGTTSGDITSNAYNSSAGLWLALSPDSVCGIVPASNLDLSRVLFTSSEKEDKKADLSVVTKSSSSEWKTTILDDTKTVTVDQDNVTRDGQKVSVPYTYTGEAVDQISVVITSGDIKAKDSTVLYYGKLADTSDAKSGTAELTLPNGLSDDACVYVLAENINAWKYTDYASEPVKLTIPEGSSAAAVQYTVTFNTQGGTAVESQTVKEGDSPSKPSVDPTKTGSAFGGWYADADCTEAYDFTDPVKSDITIYAKWTAGATSSIVDYDTTAEEAVDQNSKDFTQQNKQTSDSSFTDDGFLYKSVEWTDKAAGKARITISTKNTDVNSQNGVVYAFTKCTVHNFTPDIAAKNIQFLVKTYGSVDLVVADGRSLRDTVVIENVTSTDTNEILKMLDEKVSFRSSAHLTVALYYGLAKYLQTHDPYVIYTSFDSQKADPGSIVPDNYKTYDIWDELKTYASAGRYFSMGQDTAVINKKSSKSDTDTDMTYAMRVGLANPLCFTGDMSTDTWTVSEDTTQHKPTASYVNDFETVSKDVQLVPESFTITDTISDKFTVVADDVSANKTGAVTKVEGQTVSVSFPSMTASTVAEVYIDIQLKDLSDPDFLNQWSNTNQGDATVTYTNKDGDKATPKTVGSPKLSYTPTYKVTTEVEGGIIDYEDAPLQVNENGTATITYKPKDGYTIKSVSVGNDPENLTEVNLEENPGNKDSYTFDNITENKYIKVVYETEYNITTSVTSGTVDPCVVVKSGTTTTITSKPNDGFTLKKVTVDGEEATATPITDEEGNVTGYAVEFKDINSDHSVDFVYEKAPEEGKIQVITSVTGGTISPSQTIVTTTPVGVLVTYQPQDGYKLKSITVNDQPVEITKWNQTEYAFDGITTDQKIAVVFEPVYTITTKVNDIEGGNDGGTITPSEKKFKGENKTVDITLNDDYRIKTVTVDGVDVTETVKTNNNTYTFENISDDHTINVVFEKIPEWKITTTVNGEEGGTDGGTITPTATVPDNGTSTITIKPDPGYIVTTVTIDGKEIPLTELTPNEDGSYSYNFPNVDKDHSVDVKYVKQCTITTNVVNGTIDESVTVNQGDTKTINYKPQDDTYVLKSVTIDKGTDTEQVIDLTAHPEYAGSYTFEGVAHDHSIDVVYARQYTITTTVANGEITEDQVVWEGDKATISYTPNEGYVLRSVKVNGNDVDLTDFKDGYTIDVVNENAKVDVVYARQYKITTSVENGTIDPTQVVWEGDMATITYTPKDGYVLKSVKVNGKEVDLTDFKDGYTFDFVNEDATVDVVYARQYKITTTVENGTIDPSQVVYDNDKTTINYSPKDGYVLKSVKVNGKEVDITKFPGSYTFENLDGDATIEVVYAKSESLPKDKLTIETSVKNGTITPSVSVNKGDDMTVTYKAKDGYKLSKVLVDGKEVDITKYPTGYTFKSVSANHTIKVVFVKATGIAAKTGDTMAPIAAVSVICLAAAAGAIALVLVRRRKNA